MFLKLGPEEESAPNPEVTAEPPTPPPPPKSRPASGLLRPLGPRYSRGGRKSSAVGKRPSGGPGEVGPKRALACFEGDLMFGGFLGFGRDHPKPLTSHRSDPSICQRPAHVPQEQLASQHSCNDWSREHNKEIQVPHSRGSQIQDRR